MKKSYRKNILREMKGSLPRVIALFGIVALGVMMLAGLGSFPSSMRIAGQKHFVNQNVFDLRVLSTLGLSEDDIEAIAATEGVEAVQPVQYQELEANWSNSDEPAIVRVQEMPAEPQAEATMNRLLLQSGRMPQAAGECVVQVLGHKDAIAEGTALTVPDDAEGFVRRSYTVVGSVQDPEHFSTDVDSTTAGDGSLDAIIFVPDGSIDLDYYTVCYIKVADAAQYDNYSKEYQDTVDVVAERLEDIADAQCEARRADLIGDANAKLDDAKQDYADGEAEAQQQFAEAEAKLADAKQQLDDALDSLNEGEREYSAGNAELAAQKASLPDTMQNGADQVLTGEEQLLTFEDQVQQMELLVNVQKVAQPLLGYAEAALNNARKALDEAEPTAGDYVELRDALNKAQESYDSIANQLQGYQDQLDEGKRQLYANGLISSPTLSNEELVTEAKAALRKMKLAVLEGQLALTTGTTSAYAAFEQAEDKLAAARTQLDEGWSQYRTGKAEYEDGLAEYERQKADAEAKLADARQQITDAEEKISDISTGSWYVLDRGSTMSFVTFEQYADRMAAIARVFPVFFFLVAALVSSTTMTRMVDENRLQMGTLKALGYSNGSIAAKYLFYALVAAVLGSIAGMAIGFIVFPAIIWNAYTMVFRLTTFSLRFYPGIAAAGVGISAAVIGLATWAACRTSLREKTASLLLPRAPVAGKRIFLEYLTPLWKRMTFSQKTTARNLFRYKKRFFMTVLGVAGCTALLLIGFGIQDSILPILDKQSTELTHNDLSITLSSTNALTVENGLADTLDDSSAVESWGAFYTRSTTIYNAQGVAGSVTVVSPEDTDRMTEYFTFRTRHGHYKIPFDEDSVILTEKTANSLGLAVGDPVWVEAENGERVALTLTGVTENYLFTRLYVSQQQLASLIDSDTPTWNTVYARTSCQTEADCEAVRKDVLACNYVSAVAFTEDTSVMFNNLIGSLNYVVILVIVCAAALAAVVLYNLISVNLAERKKELATIKVLGFYDGEVYRYIFREIILLALIGSIVGLGLGVPLHQFIILTVEMDQMMFIRNIAARSYIYAVALTMLFTFAVCLLMCRHVRKISMVESMKAPE